MAAARGDARQGEGTAAVGADAARLPGEAVGDQLGATSLMDPELGPVMGPSALWLIGPSHRSRRGTAVRFSRRGSRTVRLLPTAALPSGSLRCSREAPAGVHPGPVGLRAQPVRHPEPRPGRAYPVGWNQVASPYRGLPQSSVDRIAAGGVQAEVDWVRVEQKG
ncbi:hypothetical protein GCM10010365_18780 [Streptomyces poonensis]|uniref:Uncharacterized protein n=1 Tax=Streptomyces poonensis TaxID=68255 RepID=A0A918PD68_9ACTN|nr:hypothetical protein GCM10010365_18780 [Streptomyces poonensis]GLJ92134.1 hypothetical protein GCM10017589_47430 [Streptomyces poonensis]